MNEILINLVSPTDLGRMYYSPSRSKISYPLLYLESPISRKMDYAIVIKTNIVLMFDSDGILINVEFSLPHQAWKNHSKFEDELPTPSSVADLKFIGVQSSRKKMVQPRLVKRKSGFTFNHYDLENISTEFYTDTQFTFAKVILCKHTPLSTWVELSNNCMALVSENYLKGFFINLRSNPNS